MDTSIELTKVSPVPEEINLLENEKILAVVKSTDKKTPEESATEQCASIFDLRFDPKKTKNTHTKIYPQILACVAAASFHLPVGIVVGFSAILIPQLEAPESDIKVTKEQTSWIASLAVLVVPFGAFLCGVLVDKIGRLNTIRVACVPYIIGWILIANAQTITMIFIGRFLTGFAIAMGPSPAIVYITEVARPDLRGSLICTGPSMTSLGMLFVFITGAMLPWRIVAWTGALYCAVPVLLMMLWSPESPMWLCSKGRSEQALKSLKFLARGENDNSLAEKQLSLLQAEINKKKRSDGREKSMVSTVLKEFSKPTGYKPLFILVLLFFFQQYAGIYITIFYAVTFFNDVKSGFNPYVSTILIGLIRMLIGLLTSALLKKYGRRTLCMCSGTGMSIVLAISGYYTWQIAIGAIEHSFIPVICMLTYMSLSVIGLMSIPWTMSAELFPTEIRGFAQGFTVAIAHVIMFSALQSYRPMTDAIGSYGVQWFFSGMSLLSVLFVYIFLPETHKKMLSEIQDYFRKNTIYLGQEKKKSSRSHTNNNQNNVV